MRRLNHWQRLGITASLLWVTVGGLWQYQSERYYPANTLAASLELCALADPKSPAERTHCQTKAAEDFGRARLQRWYDVLSFALEPVAASCLLAYGTLLASRWILAGASKHDR